MIRFVLAFCIAFLAATPQAFAQRARSEQNVVFVMMDGLRWQEVFRGADPELAANPEYMKSAWAASARARFVDTVDRRAALMPFLHEVIEQQGVLIGDRDHGSCAGVTNDRWFSYPGYNEALTGRADARINSNDYPPNPNVTFLEWLNRRPGFAGKVRAAGSWDAFGRIINAERSGVPVNAGFASDGGGDPATRMLDALQADTAHQWDIVRWDSFTHQYALAGLRRHHPRAMFISYGETDDFAHEGDYAQYLISANRNDRFVRELWTALQADRFYAGRTTLILTVDHGRGNVAGDSWRHHYSPAALREGTSPLRERYPDGIPGSDQTWMAALGPSVSARAADPYAGRACAGLDQLAATALTALGQDWRAFNAEAGIPLNIFRANANHQ
jgi:hypothetical protein